MCAGGACRTDGDGDAISDGLLPAPRTHSSSISTPDRERAGLKRCVHKIA